jgi:DNA topoisomerase I
MSNDGAQPANPAVERRNKWWQRKGASYDDFRYFDCEGKPVKGKAEIERLNKLAIPPAWTSVRICPKPGGRLQAIGIDAAGRVQYIYHPSFVSKQERKKFAKIEIFGNYLPKLRKATNRDIRLKGYPREKVLAIMIRLVNLLYMRIGGEKSAETFRTYGITTLQNKHLTIKESGELIFDYVGKSYIQHRKVLADKKLAKELAGLRRLGTNKKLFHYITEEGKPKPVTPTELNQYLKDSTSPEFSLKDFRTWGATLLAAVKFAEIGVAEAESEVKKNVVGVVREVAEELGNTPAVCRASYIHPEVIRAYEKGQVISSVRRDGKRSVKKIEPMLTPEERSLVKFFKRLRAK